MTGKFLAGYSKTRGQLPVSDVELKKEAPLVLS